MGRKFISQDPVINFPGLVSGPQSLIGNSDDTAESSTLYEAMDNAEERKKKVNGKEKVQQAVAVAFLP